MKKLSRIPRLLGAACLSMLTVNGFAQTQVYFENFDIDHTANWSSNATSVGNHLVNFYFDYSTVGIPSAPNSVGGSTRGMKINANLGPTPASVCGMSASPIGVNLAGDYEVHFDMWCNFNGPAPAGGSGSTQISGAGIGSSGTYANYPGRADCIWFAVSGDGGSSDDYRAYSQAYPTSYQYNTEGGVYASSTTVATARNNTDPYWSTNFPGQAIPATQTALYAQQTGTTANGAQGFKWRNAVIRKAGNQVTFKIDGILIATINASTAGTLGGGNLSFIQSDINTGVSTDVNRTNLLFGLFDNIRVTNLAQVVSVSTTTPATAEGGAASWFTITRDGTDTSSALTVNLSVGGTATSGSDYSTISSTATILAGATSVDVPLTVNNDTEAEFDETVVLNLLPGSGYSLGTTAATITVSDNEKPAISVQIFRPSAYERVAGDYIQYKVVRKGELNAGFDVNLTYSGSAAPSRFSGPPTVYLPWGNVSETFNVTPVDNATLDGNQTVVATVTDGGTFYDVDSTSPSATGTIIDDEQPPVGGLYTESFNTAESAAGWTNRFGSGNGIDDYTATFGFDYGALLGIPAAPHGTDTTGLYLTVNKAEGTGSGAAGINFYPLTQSFSGDYAIRCDMYLIVNSTVTSEYALIGLNHSGNQTNWMRWSGNGFTNSVYDGIWASIEADATGTDDYLFLTGPVTQYGGIWSPNELVRNDARSFTNVFKSPPWWSVTGSQPGGSPSNPQSSSTPCWADLELSQVAGIVTLKINQVEIMRYTNATAYSSGNVMIGYADPFDSNTGTGGAVIFDNLRVVDMTSTVTITDFDIVGGNVEITFRANSGDSTGDFTVQKSSALPGGFADTTASFSSLGGGFFKAVRALDGPGQFYRVKKN